MLFFFLFLFFLLTNRFCCFSFFCFFLFILCVIGVPISDMLYKDRHGHNSKDGKADVNPSTFLKFLANAGCFGEVALGREFFLLFFFFSQSMYLHV